jgi:hypothetical protein
MERSLFLQVRRGPLLRARNQRRRAADDPDNEAPERIEHGRILTSELISTAATGLKCNRRTGEGSSRPESGGGGGRPCGRTLVAVAPSSLSTGPLRGIATARRHDDHDEIRLIRTSPALR